jgi:acid phosphatase class B
MKTYRIFRNLLWILLAGLLPALLFGGCTTIKYVPVKEVRADTVYKAHKDSIHLITVRNIVDSIRWRDSVSTQVDSSGKVTRTDTWHWREHTSLSTDSTRYYKSALDSALKSRVDSIPKPYPVMKTKAVYKIHWWQYPLLWMGALSLLLSAGWVLKILIRKGIIHL